MLPFFKPKKGFQFAGSGLDAGSGGGGGGGGSIDTSALANKTDLTAIILTGTTNTSGNVISAGTWFYLNGKPCISKVDIASGATFTEGTNYEEKTIGSALTELNSNISDKGDWNFFAGPAFSEATNIDLTAICPLMPGSNLTVTSAQFWNPTTNWWEMIDLTKNQAKVEHIGAEARIGFHGLKPGTGWYFLQMSVIIS